ncbi:MAG: aminotransferase class V-fold PLP-dependent enzyme [Longimicrobiales bacterium]|nr:aminotransferase class V-fold PLP-dependent enzyme [Longimicrobiales bacterium]
MTPADAPPYDLAALRRGIPLLERAIPMNHCSQAPQTTATREAALAYLESWNERGMAWDRWIEEVEAARATFARLIGAEPDEVAVFSSVSHATAAVASCVDLLAEQTGRSTVALTEAEFPTVAQVWGARAARGTPLRWIPVDPGTERVEAEAVEAALDDDVLLLSAAHGYYQNGALLDLERVAASARAAGVLTCIDAYQSLGTRPLDVKAIGVDLLASGNLKFLMGIPGVAFLYVRREVAERMEPAVTGWFGRADPFAFDPFRDRPLDWAEGAKRFDGGTPPILPAWVARAGMELLLETGLEAIGAWTARLARHLIEGGRERGLDLMGPADPAERAPTVAFRVADAHAVEERLRRDGVIASARGPALRLAPHYHSTLEDAERALDLLAAATR